MISTLGTRLAPEKLVETRVLAISSDLDQLRRIVAALEPTRTDVEAQKRRDKLLAQQRARAVLDHLATQGVTVQQLQAVGSSATPSDAANERVDFITTQQVGAV